VARVSRPHPTGPDSGPEVWAGDGLTPCSIVRPDRDRTEDGVLAVTHDQTFANPTLKAKTPFVKPPVYIDYGIRLRVGGSTFINRNCTIMDTPVADVVIGEGCNIGPNCVITGVTRKSWLLSLSAAASGAVPGPPTRPRRGLLSPTLLHDLQGPCRGRRLNGKTQIPCGSTSASSGTASASQ
jgi:hypothetical protein